MTFPTITYDRQVNAAYIRFSNREVDHTVELSLSVYVDVDVDGDPIGFEILNVDPELSASLPELPGATALRDLLSRNAA